MKTFHTKLKTSFAVILTLTSLGALAKPIAQVREVSGLAFTISPTGETKRIKANEILNERSEVLLEEGARLSFNDYYNAIYHLTGGTHMKLYDRSVQLKKGKTWVKSSSNNNLMMTTANGIVDYAGGQFIATFDQVNSRSQILVVQGQVAVSNILDENFKFNIDQGHFTLIDPEIENGVPRAPTNIGMASLKSALDEFQMKESAPVANPTAPTRAIASVRSLETPMMVQKGEILFINSNALPRAVDIKKSNRMPASVSAKKNHHRFGPAKISYYGQKLPHSSQRTPASAPEMSGSNELEIGAKLKKDQLVRPAYSNELESLINDLKSY